MNELLHFLQEPYHCFLEHHHAQVEWERGVQEDLNCEDESSNVEVARGRTGEDQKGEGNDEVVVGCTEQGHNDRAGNSTVRRKSMLLR